MRKPLNIALLGADDPLGEAILRMLSERELDIGEVFPLSLSESDGCVTVRGEELPLLHANGFDWSRADLLLDAVRSPAAARTEATASAAGCRVIGLGHGGDIAGRTGVDGALSTALHRVLAPIQRETPLAFLAVTAMLPVAVAGEAGVAELVSQTRALFAMEQVESEVFPLRVAFNLIPQVGPMLPDASSQFETELAGEARSMLGDSDLPMAVTAIWAPLFYGAAMAVHGVVRDTMDLDTMRKRLSGLTNVTVMDAALPGGVPTPATDAQDSDTVFVGRFRRESRSDKHFSMWLVVDMVRLEASRIVDCVEKSIEK